MRRRAWPAPDRRVIEQVPDVRSDGHRIPFPEERSVRRSGGRSGRAYARVVEIEVVAAIPGRPSMESSPACATLAPPPSSRSRPDEAHAGREQPDEPGDEP